MISGERKAKFIIDTVYYAIIIILSALFIKYLLSPLLPFIAAFIIAAVSRKLILGIEDYCHSKRFSSLLFTILLVLILSLSLYGIAHGLFRELTKLAGSISDESVTKLFGTISEKLEQFLDGFSDFPFWGRITKSISGAFGSLDKAISAFGSSALPSVVGFLMRFISFFPTAVIFLCFTFIAVFYISADYEKICSFLMMQLPEKTLDTFDETKNVIFSTAKELFKSYFLLTFITFLQLLVGFLIIRIDYALILAAVISIIDLLPILGTGTVLVPWAAVCFIINDYTTAAGLTVLYVVITIFRQIAQPRIIGAGAGLHPLVSLISIFAGLKLMGISGVIVFPIITATVIKLNKKGFIRLYRDYPEKSCEAVKKTRTKFLNFKRNDSHRTKPQGSDIYDNDNNNKGN